MSSFTQRMRIVASETSWLVDDCEQIWYPIPSGYVKIAIETAIEIVDLSSYKMLIFHRLLYVYQRVFFGEHHHCRTINRPAFQGITFQVLNTAHVRAPIPSGKRLHNYGKSPFLWENQLFL